MTGSLQIHNTTKALISLTLASLPPLPAQEQLANNEALDLFSVQLEALPDTARKIGEKLRDTFASASELQLIQNINDANYQNRHISIAKEIVALEPEARSKLFVAIKSWMSQLSENQIELSQEIHFGLSTALGFSANYFHHRKKAGTFKPNTEEGDQAYLDIVLILHAQGKNLLPQTYKGTTVALSFSMGPAFEERQSEIEDAHLARLKILLNDFENSKAAFQVRLMAMEPYRSAVNISYKALEVLSPSNPDMIKGVLETLDHPLYRTPIKAGLNNFILPSEKIESAFEAWFKKLSEMPQVNRPKLTVVFRESIRSEEAKPLRKLIAIKGLQMLAGGVVFKTEKPLVVNEIFAAFNEADTILTSLQQSDQTTTGAAFDMLQSLREAAFSTLVDFDANPEITFKAGVKLLSDDDLISHTPIRSKLLNALREVFNSRLLLSDEERSYTMRALVSFTPVSIDESEAKTKCLESFLKHR